MPANDVIQQPANGSSSTTQAVIRALVCAHCRKGRLDPAGKRPGEQVACPACGGLSKVTLEMTLGEEKLLERQRNREKAKRTFAELSEEEKLEFIAKKGGVAQMYWFLQYRLGPKGMLGLYLGAFLLVAGLVLAYALTFGGMEIRAIAWYWWVLTIVGGGVLGFVGWFVHGTASHYYKKHKAASGGDTRRTASARRNATTVRTAKPSTTARRPGQSSRTNGPR